MTTVKYNLDVAKPPKTPKEDLERLRNLSDEDIDTSDIPELDENFWASAKIVHPKTKPNISLRVSQDVVDYFKAESPKGYTGRMAAVLSAYVQAHQLK